MFSHRLIGLLAAATLVLGFGCGDEGDPVADATGDTVADATGDTVADATGDTVAAFCPPEGPFGTHPGDTFTDVVVKDCDGNDVHLHELCGAPAGYFNLLAGW